MQLTRGVPLNIQAVDDAVGLLRLERVVSRSWSRSRRLSLDDLTFHDLRHECVSGLFERGWGIPGVAGVSGHESWGTLQRYIHLRESEPYDKYDGWRWRPR